MITNGTAPHDRGVGQRLSSADKDRLHSMIREIVSQEPDLRPSEVLRRVRNRGFEISPPAFHRHFDVVCASGITPIAGAAEEAEHVDAEDADEPSHMIRCDTPHGYSVANPHGDSWQININVSTDLAGALQLHELATRLLLGQGAS